jgi:hypothetical protein
MPLLQPWRLPSLRRQHERLGHNVRGSEFQNGRREGTCAKIVNACGLLLPLFQSRFSPMLLSIHELLHLVLQGSAFFLQSLHVLALSSLCSSSMQCRRRRLF